MKSRVGLVSGLRRGSERRIGLVDIRDASRRVSACHFRHPNELRPSIGTADACLVRNPYSMAKKGVIGVALQAVIFRPKFP